MKTDVIIVGGGIAGLVCARQLSQAGYTVVIFEASPHFGGRIATDEKSHTERGARVLHDWPTHPLHSFLVEAGLQFTQVDYERTEIVDTHGNPLSDLEQDSVNELALEFAGALQETAEEQPQDLSVMDVADHVLSQAEELTSTERQVIDWLLSCRELETGLNLHQASYQALSAPDDLLNNDHLETQDVIPVGGMQPVLSHLARGLDIRLSTPIATVHWNTEKPSVITSSGMQHSAHAVVITVPVGALQNNTVEFSPCLPAPYQDAIESLKMGAEVRVTLDYPDVQWHEKPHFFGLLSTDKPAFPQLINHWPTEHLPRLTAVAAGRHAELFMKMTDDDLIAHAQKAMQTISQSPLPTPAGAVVTRWGQPPYINGSISAVPVGVDPMVRARLAAPLERLIFAGEAATMHHPGTLEGAVYSGIAAATYLERLL